MLRSILVILLVALPASAKTLHWRSIDVEARLDRDGNLHVVERQQIVFDGDWNGGERSFDLRGRQRLELHRLIRIDDGREIALVEGDLDRIDGYDFSGQNVLRWRSRLPSDPPFSAKELTYILDYTYANVLEAEEGEFVLDHDFGLPERSGAVDVFTLELEFDPIWNSRAISQTRTGLPPGQGMPVRKTLVHAAGMKPPVYRGGYATLAAFGAAAAFLIFMFVRDERPTGRFDRVDAKLDPELLSLRAEVAGAIWDADVGAPEVAATIARMTQEGKIESSAEKKELSMRLKVPGHELHGYERHLANALFFAGDETSTERIRTHYKSSGVDFAALIRPGIETKVSEAVPGWNARARRFQVRTHVVSLGAALLLLAVPGFFGDPEDLGETLVILVLGAIFGLLACAAASHASRAIGGFFRAFLTPALLLMIPIAFLALGAIRAYPPGRISLPVLVACAIWLLAILRLTLDMLKIPESREVIAVRKRVLATRKYFVEQLRLKAPDLKDDWFPHLLAFGLGKHANRWFRAFGGAGSSARESFASSGSSSGSSSSAGWSGGGGAFGGAGATGSWAAAATAIGSGVATPSSSGGSSGGGSSSGGGGGGGW